MALSAAAVLYHSVMSETNPEHPPLLMSLSFYSTTNLLTLFKSERAPYFLKGVLCKLKIPVSTPIYGTVHPLWSAWLNLQLDIFTVRVQEAVFQVHYRGSRVSFGTQPCCRSAYPSLWSAAQRVVQHLHDCSGVFQYPIE